MVFSGIFVLLQIINRQTLIHIQMDNAIRIHFVVKQECQCGEIFLRQPIGPLWLGRHLLEQQGVDVDQANLERV